uniref:U1-type domain-containing protein n=1 Tax=Acanthochromis polyacanthus TaxID=80966 RepID=A0A3Q1FWQ8_9TELE
MAKRLPVAPSSSAKKLRNLTLTPQYRAEQFPNDFCASGEQLLCRFCQHSIDWKRKNTCSDHILSKSHVRNKEKFNSNASKTKSLQTCITASTFKSLDSRKEFIEDSVAMCAEADIPLEKMTKLRLFLLKHCKQGGALSNAVGLLRRDGQHGQNQLPLTGPDQIHHLLVRRSFHVHAVADKRRNRC